MDFTKINQILATTLANKKVVVCGGCHVGKTTVAASYSGRVYHTDDLINTHEWSEVSEVAAQWMAVEGGWLIEGVAGSRALRKALDSSEKAPCDVVIRLTTPVSDVNKNHIAMNKGEATVWGKIEQSLLDRGVIVINFIDENTATMQQGTEVVNISFSGAMK